MWYRSTTSVWPQYSRSTTCGKATPLTRQTTTISSSTGCGLAQARRSRSGLVSASCSMISSRLMSPNMAACTRSPTTLLPIPGRKNSQSTLALPHKRAHRPLAIASSHARTCPWPPRAHPLRRLFSTPSCPQAVESRCLQHAERCKGFQHRDHGQEDAIGTRIAWQGNPCNAVPCDAISVPIVLH
jgi:hypothetical protein